MAVRTIYVDPGDLVRVRVMGDELEQKNEKGWCDSSMRPYSFTFTVNTNSISISNPGEEIYLQTLKEKPKRIY